VGSYKNDSNLCLKFPRPCYLASDRPSYITGHAYW
jgi:hypothetical protein